MLYIVLLFHCYISHSYFHLFFLIDILKLCFLRLNLKECQIFSSFRRFVDFTYFVQVVDKNVTFVYCCQNVLQTIEIIEFVLRSILILMSKYYLVVKHNLPFLHILIFVGDNFLCSYQIHDI